MIPGSANPLLLASAASAPAGYAISRSLRFNSSDSAYLSRTPALAGNRKTWTWAGWVKRSGLGTDQALLDCRPVSSDSQFSIFYLKSTNTLEFSGPVTTWFTTSAVFRDCSAWMHIVLALDTTQATAANRIKLYVNGSQITAFSTSANPSQNADLGINQAALHGIGAATTPSAYLNGYFADIHFIDGQALDPTSFGQFDSNGIWQPKAYTGTYPGNSFHLDFADNSTAAALGTDTSGAGNNWTVNNISVAAGAGNDSLVDVPTNGSETDTGSGGEVRGNYATLNPLQTGSGATLSNGNLDISTTSTSWQPSVSSIFQSSGKWYAEFTVTTSTANSIHIGIVGPSFSVAAGNYIGVTATSYAYRADGGTKYNNATQLSYGASYTTGDVIGVAMDLDAGTLVFYKNGTSQGTAYTGMTGEKAFAVSVGGTSGTHAVTANFGQRPFAYTAPSGFKALCTANLPAPLVTKPSEYMDVVTYTGNGSTQTISGLEFSPDLVWIKSRSNTLFHFLIDTVRGNNLELYSNATNAESSNTTTLTAFNSDGFDLGNRLGTNENTGSYVAWTWDAGSSTVTNTDGSISSQVRANPSAGFSIVSYTGNGSSGATVGHGLNAAPEMIIVKQRSSSTVNKNWVVYHAALGNTGGLVLNTTAAQTTTVDYWNNSSPSSSTFTLGPGDDAYGSQTNVNSKDYIAYCFAPVSGYSNGFSYTGNGSADGSFVYLGFRPRLILLKCSSTTGNWTLLDTAREGYNVDNDPLYPNLSNAEGTTDLLDITSNGFKLRTTNASVNANAATYVGFAWAESPFNYSRAR